MKNDILLSVLVIAPGNEYYLLFLYCVIRYIFNKTILIAGTSINYHVSLPLLDGIKSYPGMLSSCHRFIWCALSILSINAHHDWRKQGSQQYLITAWWSNIYNPSQYNRSLFWEIARIYLLNYNTSVKSTYTVRNLCVLATHSLHNFYILFSSISEL